VYPLENYESLLEYNSLLLFDEQGKVLGRKNLKEEKKINFASATGIFNLKPVTYKDAAVLPMNNEFASFKISRMGDEYSIAKQSADSYSAKAGPRLMHEVLINPASSLVFIITTNERYDMQTEYSLSMAASSSSDGSLSSVGGGGGVRRMLQKTGVLTDTGDVSQQQDSTSNIFRYDMNGWGQSQMDGFFDVRSFFDGGRRSSGKTEEFYKGPFQVIATASRDDALIFCGSPIKHQSDLIVLAMHHPTTLKEIGRFELSTADSFSPPSKAVLRPTKIFLDPTDSDVYFIITEAALTVGRSAPMA
jgi:hypothetical protein